MSKNISDAKKRISELEKSLHKIDINVKDYNEASDKTIEDINKQRIQIKSNIDTIADNMANQVQKRREQDVQLMEKKGKDIQKVITDYKEYLTSCRQEKSVDNIADFKHQLKKPAESNIHTIIHTNHLIFVGDNSMKFQDMFGKLVDLLDESKSKQKMPDSEKVQKKKPTTDDETDGILITTISTQELLKTNSDASRLHDIRCFYVSAVNDQKAWCGGLNEMILVGIHGNVQRKVTLDNYSCGLAVTSLSELLVTVTSMIKKYLPDGKCVDIANTKPYHSKGITLTSQGDILVCLCKSKYDNKVVRMTTAGHVKQTIQKNKQHQPLFTNPQHVAENVNGDVVVVDNNVHAFIVVTNKEGRLKYMYPDFEQSFHIIDECSGIACDSIGCILVSDYLNHKIHQIDIDGRFIQFILSEQEGIQLPWGLSIDNKGQLWLGNENGLEVTVYKYSS
ncbi:hypothetical protein KUTeg_009330 [Tegillarca granosa]|uniref:Uncharacterized protein n=1 Tax=Tegillarca granosa TaxID=220873 RepID=A0ABQ9F6Q6_TEGGR|nr:hypothetical protein KUTeg_009330 [Tegillarca granosa]